MSVRLSCPSCNTAFALDAVPADRRAACPRCGDVFPVRGEAAEQAGDTGEPAAPLFPKHQPPNTERKTWSSRRLARVAVGVALFGLGVTLALYYTTRDPKPKAEAQPEMPLKLREALDFVPLISCLPAECNIVFAVRPDLIIEYAARTNQNPRDLLVRLGVPAQVFAALDQLGLGLEAIDHVVGGAYLGGDGEELRVAIAIETKAHLAKEETIRRRLKVRPVPNKPGLVSAEIAHVPIPLLIRSGHTSWVFGLSEKDFQAGKGDRQQGRHLHGVEVRGGREQVVGIRKLLDRVPRDAAIWIAADDDRDWTQKPLVKLAAQSPEVKKWLPGLSGVRGFLFAAGFGEKPYMNLRVRPADTATAERVEAFFRGQGITGHRPGPDQDVVFGAPFDPALLQRMLADAAK